MVAVGQVCSYVTIGVRAVRGMPPQIEQRLWDFSAKTIISVTFSGKLPSQNEPAPYAYVFD